MVDIKYSHQHLNGNNNSIHLLLAGHMLSLEIILSLYTQNLIKFTPPLNFFFT